MTDTIFAVCLVISVNWQNWGQDMRHHSVSQTCVSHPCEKSRTGLVLCLRPIIKPDLPFVILAKPVGTKCRLKLVMHKHQWRRQSLSTNHLNEPKDISLWGHGEGKWAEKKRKTLIFNDCLHHTQWLSGWVQTPYSQLLVCFEWHLGLPWFSHLSNAGTSTLHRADHGEA